MLVVQIITRRSHEYEHARARSLQSLYHLQYRIGLLRVCDDYGN